MSDIRLPVKVIVVCGQKGGTSKSTICTNLAAHFAGEGVDVFLLDCDAQATSANWIERRNDAIAAGLSVPKVHVGQKSGKVFDAVNDYAKRYELVIVDVGGGDSPELRTALAAADKAFIPFAASQADLETLDHMNDVIAIAKGLNEELDTYGVLSMIPYHPTRKHYNEAREFLKEFQHIDLVDSAIGFRQIYKDALKEGVGVAEMKTKSKARSVAAAEIQLFAQEIMK